MVIDLAQEKRSLQFVGLCRIFPWRYQKASRRINWQKSQIDGVPFNRFESQWQAYQQGNVIQRFFNYLWYGSRQTVYDLYQERMVAGAIITQPQQSYPTISLSPVTLRGIGMFFRNLFSKRRKARSFQFSSTKKLEKPVNIEENNKKSLRKIEQQSIDLAEKNDSEGITINNPLDQLLTPREYVFSQLVNLHECYRLLAEEWSTLSKEKQKEMLRSTEQLCEDLKKCALRDLNNCVLPESSTYTLTEMTIALQDLFAQFQPFDSKQLTEHAKPFFLNDAQQLAQEKLKDLQKYYEVKAQQLSMLCQEKSLVEDSRIKQIKQLKAEVKAHYTGVAKLYDPTNWQAITRDRVQAMHYRYIDVQVAGEERFFAILEQAGINLAATSSSQAVVLSPVTTENTSAFVPDEPTSPTAANSLTAQWQEDKVNIDTFWQDRIQPLLELQGKDYGAAKQIMCEALTSYYRRLAKRYHPDRHSEQQEEATQIFKELTDYIAKKRADLDKDSHLNGFNPTAFADLQRSFDELFQEYQAFWDKQARDIHKLREAMKKSDEMLHENADNLAKMDIKLKQMGIKQQENAIMQQENAIKLEQMGIKQHENAIKLERMGIRQQENAVKLVQMGDKLNKVDMKVASLENNMALIIAKMGLNASNLKIEMNAKTTAPFNAAPLMAEKPQVAETYQP